MMKQNTNKMTKLIMIILMTLVALSCSSRNNLPFVVSAAAAAANVATTKSQKQQQQQQQSKEDTTDALEEEKQQQPTLGLKPIELTSRNFDSSVGDGNVWLIEFYTPWCSHCQQFATSYSNIAASFHSSPNEKIRVGKIDGTKQKALLARFDIHSFPSFYLIDGWSVYEFDNVRSVANLMDFVRGGYKKQSALPFLFSPMGPLGLVQGKVVVWGGNVLDWFHYFQSQYGSMSPILLAMILCVVVFIGGICSIILLTILITPSTKEKDN